MKPRKLDWEVYNEIDRIKKELSTYDNDNIDDQLVWTSLNARLWALNWVMGEDE